MRSAGQLLGDAKQLLHNCPSCQGHACARHELLSALSGRLRELDVASYEFANFRLSVGLQPGITIEEWERRCEELERAELLRKLQKKMR